MNTMQRIKHFISKALPFKDIYSKIYIEVRESLLREMISRVSYKGFSDGDNCQYFVCQNGLRTLFCIGYKNGNMFYQWSKSLQCVHTISIFIPKRAWNTRATTSKFGNDTEINDSMLVWDDDINLQKRTRNKKSLPGVIWRYDKLPPFNLRSNRQRKIRYRYQ